MKHQLNENLFEDDLSQPEEISIEVHELSDEEKKAIKRAKHIERYKSILGLPKEFIITIDNLDEWALKHMCNLEGVNYDQAKKEILGEKWEGYGQEDID